MLKLKFEELDLVSTDSNWHQKFFSNNNMQYKILSLSKLSLSLRCEKNLRRNEKTKMNSSRGPDSKGYFQKRAGMSSNDYDTDLIYRRLREKESFLLHPIDFHLDITFLNHILNQNELSKEAHMKIKADITRPIILMMNKEQKEYLTNMGDHFKSLETIQNNLHIRPTYPVKKKALGWFIYSVRATIEKNRFLKLNFQRAMQQFFLMKKYISLYKKKQNIVIII